MNDQLPNQFIYFIRSAAILGFNLNTKEIFKVH